MSVNEGTQTVIAYSENSTNHRRKFCRQKKKILINFKESGMLGYHRPTDDETQ
jgi:hypothetical protein